MIKEAQVSSIQDSASLAEYANFREIHRRFGIPESQARVLLGLKKIRAKKPYKRVLIEIASVKEFLAAAPDANLKSRRQPRTPPGRIA